MSFFGVNSRGLWIVTVIVQWAGTRGDLVGEGRSSVVRFVRTPTDVTVGCYSILRGVA